MLVNDVLKKIEAAMVRWGMNQIMLSEAIGVPQSTLSRSLSQPVRVTKTHRKICNFLCVPVEVEIDGRGADELQKAVSEVWDGSDQHALALARLLRAASRVSTTGSYASRRSS